MRFTAGKRHILFAVLVFSGAVAALIFLFNGPQRSGGLDRIRPSAPTIRRQQLTKSNVHLYFADKDNSFLASEERALFHADDPAHLAESIINALIKGPQAELMRTLPADTALRALYVTPDGVGYIDLTADVHEKHPGGSQSELLTIYSIVNSLILNVPEIKRVKILIGGQESQTLAGHVDIRFPVRAKMLLIR
ncbi:MAG: GerMN domain-containing protein [Desulfobacterales bacterium]|nr:MAG: GerMN domain-containing protein [Desulfobacterales bacterium]